MSLAPVTHLTDRTRRRFGKSSLQAYDHRPLVREVASTLQFMRPCKSLRLSTAVAAAVLVFVCCAPLSTARVREYPVMASSADDVRLRNKLVALSPTTVRADEARRVAICAYTTGQEFRRKWRVVWPPGLQVVLVNTGRREGGLCYQWATVLLLRLNAMKLQTLEPHWAESFANTLSEHNVIVVTAKGQPFIQGILLDNWRCGGHLLYGLAAADPEYKWRENRGEAARRLKAGWTSVEEKGHVRQAVKERE